MNKMELPFIREMFDAISPKYDLLNRLLSLRQDVYWRREMVRAMRIPDKGGMVLDIACGTGDVALEILRQKGSGVNVFGADFSPGMLRLAKDKIKHSGIHLLAGNAFHLPFREETFDAVTIAFGIRNIADKLSVLKKFHEHLKPGGMILVLELATPPKGLLLSLYLFYFKKILPIIGWFFSKNLMAYKYLPASVMNFPPAPAFAEIMRSAGFSNVSWRRLTFGIATLYAGIKP